MKNGEYKYKIITRLGDKIFTENAYRLWVWSYHYSEVYDISDGRDIFLGIMKPPLFDYVNNHSNSTAEDIGDLVIGYLSSGKWMFDL